MMQVLTFEQWCDRNEDLLDDMRAELHPCGETWGLLEVLGAEGARAHLTRRMRELYDVRLQEDLSALKAWNEAVSSVGVN